MNRLMYLGVTVVTTLVASVSMQMTKVIEQSGRTSDEAVLFSVALIIAYIVYMVATFYRFKNAGINPWWSLTGLIPLVTIGTWIVGLSRKPKIEFST